MRLIGLTGNIASGKSTVAQLFAERGATIIDADELARNAVAVGSVGHRKIIERWGDDILKADGGLDRVALRQIVFQEPVELEALNSIVHPEVSRLRDDLINEARDRGDETVICDIPLLFERGMVDDFDKIVLVDAPRPLRLERLTRERALGQTEAMNMIASQMPAELKRARADYIIENESNLEALEKRVDEVWRALHASS
ncbi:MAG: dephospho-CoA kinase [Gemmatimonadota bacterium]|nr:dephospho-CoA kinase [Gemmatimonadota bacterium]